MRKGILLLQMPSACSRQQQGTSLIEVLMTATVIGMGVIGLLRLQSFGLVLAQDSLQRQTATLLLMDLSEHVRVNSEALQHIDGIYLNNPISTTANCASRARCTPEQFARYQVFAWKNRAAALLPDAEVEIDRSSELGGVSWQVSISWFSDAGEPVSGRIVL
ncbi:MAG: type IV pilus modification protein PilV [Pseudohongiella sp.]|nr:type IV pilus modification protein PilV [Pseudohongiella sp.]